MTYTYLVVLGVAFAAALDLALLRTNLLRRKAFWVAYAIIFGFQLVVNGILTGRDIVQYDDQRILGLRIAYAPVEDLLFGFSLVLQTLAWWVWWGRRANQARVRPGPATASRRPRPTDTRRSSTR